MPFLVQLDVRQILPRCKYCRRKSSNCYHRDSRAEYVGIDYLGAHGLDIARRRHCRLGKSKGMAKVLRAMRKHVCVGANPGSLIQDCSIVCVKVVTRYKRPSLEILDGNKIGKHHLIIRFSFLTKIIQTFSTLRAQS